MSHIDLQDPELSLQDLMTRWPDTIPVFLKHRMLCVGCVFTRFHTLTDACQEHGLDEQSFRAELEAVIAAR